MCNVICDLTFFVFCGCYVRWVCQKFIFFHTWNLKWGYHVNLGPAKVLNCCHSDGRGFVALPDIARNVAREIWKFI